MCHAFLHRHEDAVECYSAAIILHGNDARFYHNRAQSFARLGRQEEAAADEAKAVDIRDRMASKMQAVARGKRQRAIVAQMLAVRAATRIQANYRGKMARRKLEADLTERGDAGKLALLRDAQANKKGANDGGAEAVALFEQACKFLGAGSLDEARDSFQAAADGNPPHPRPSRCYNGLGLVQLGLGDPDAAVLAFTKAIELDPIDYRALHNRAEAHKRAGNFSAAAADAASAAALNSNAATSAASRQLMNISTAHRAAQRLQA